MLMKAVLSGLVLSSALANYAKIGNNYCRGPGGNDDKLLKRKHTMHSDAMCREICDLAEDCTGYHWQEDKRCMIYSVRVPEKVKATGRDKGECFAKLPENSVACEDWCHDEIDCLSEETRGACGDCDMPDCPDSPDSPDAPFPSGISVVCETDTAIWMCNCNDQCNTNYCNCAEAQACCGKSEVDDNYVKIGNNYCRGYGGDEHELQKMKHTGVNSDAECRGMCDEAFCSGYHWQKDGRCLIFTGFVEKVKSYGNATGTCWAKINFRRFVFDDKCQGWCYEELDCLSEGLRGPCGDCDMPECQDEPDSSA